MQFLFDHAYGLLDLSFWQYVLISVVMIQLTIMGVTLYLHRDQCHRGVDLHPALRHFFRFWIWLTTGMGTREWVAVHRKHHALCETEDDPHSPKIVGLRKVLLEGAELYKVESKNPETLEKYGRGTPNDWLERNVYMHPRYSFMGVALFVVLSILLFGVAGIIILAAQLISIPLFAAGVINGLGHHTGYRNFECDDAATNIVPWAFLLGGEELHNNHHAFPSSSKFSMRKWEFDIGWMYLTILRTLGLAKIRRVAPRPHIEPSTPVDLDTLRAVIVNRMHVLRDYSTRVTIPVLRREQRRAPGESLLRRARTLLVRQTHLLDEAARSRLNDLLESNQSLRTVHDFRERLQELWGGANMSNEHMLAHFRDWCEKAEASGIRALEEFVAQIRGYRMQPA